MRHSTWETVDLANADSHRATNSASFAPDLGFQIDRRSRLPVSTPECCASWHDAVAGLQGRKKKSGATILVDNLPVSGFVTVKSGQVFAANGQLRIVIPCMLCPFWVSKHSSRG
jgi:hypothetical protein